MATYILIHGAWHGGWCWDPLISLLRAAGHEVVAPDLPGMGDDQRTLGSDPLGEWSEFVAALVAAADSPVILVGHSRGGTVISETSERVPELIDTLVYLTAFLLRPGESLAEFAQRYPDVGPMNAVRPADDPSRLDIDRELAIPIFYNRCSAEQARDAVIRLRPEPLAALTTPLRVSSDRFGSVRRVYIEATDDRAITLAMQREMQAALPCATVITLDADHSSFMSATAALADALLSFA